MIEANKDRPFPLYLAHRAPHTPLHATREDYEALSHIEFHRERVYAAMIRNLDRGVGRVPEALFWRGGASLSALVGGWKMNVSDPPGRSRLFDLRIDPTEQRDLAREHPDKLADLQAALAAHDAAQAEPLRPSQVAVPINLDKDLSQPDSPDDAYNHWSSQETRVPTPKPHPILDGSNLSLCFRRVRVALAYDGVEYDTSQQIPSGAPPECLGDDEFMVERAFSIADTTLTSASRVSWTVEPRP